MAPSARNSRPNGRQKLPEPFESLCHTVIGAAFRVANTLGPDLNEVLYERAMQVELRNNGIPFESQVPMPMTYAGEVIGEYRIDLVIDRLIVVELKSVESLVVGHIRQVTGYLKASGLKVGLLMNFQSGEVEVKRVLNGDLK